MTLPRPGQTVHLLTRWDVLRVVLDLHRKEGRNVHELRLYAVDDLRRLYQSTEGDIIRLRDGIVSRVQLAAVIRWRLWLAARSAEPDCSRCRCHCRRRRLAASRSKAACCIA